MSAEDVLCMRFGEYQDLMACDAIFRGVAEEKAAQLTQEEMYELE